LKEANKVSNKQAEADDKFVCFGLFFENKHL